MRRQDDGSDGGMEEGEVRVGALGGEGGAVWAVRLASSLVFVLVVVVVLRCSMCSLGRDLAPKTTELSSVLASKDGAATQQHV